MGFEPGQRSSECWIDSEGCRGKNTFGGADGIVIGPVKKTQEKPLNIRNHCHLLILASSLGGLRRPFGHPHNARMWQQLATVRARALGATLYLETPSDQLLTEDYSVAALIKELDRTDRNAGS